MNCVGITEGSTGTNFRAIRVKNKYSTTPIHENTMAFTVIGVLLVGGLLGSYYIAKTYNLDYKELVTRNLIILGIIALVEFVFVTYIAKQFISADPNYVKRIIAKTLDDYSKNKN